MTEDQGLDFRPFCRVREVVLEWFGGIGRFLGETGVLKALSRQTFLYQTAQVKTRRHT